MAKCFIITPYGKKKDATGKTVNFDRIFNALIERVVSDAGLEPLRSDHDLESGPIFRKMIHDIATAEVCIADITTLNPNVFYELGVRHALCRGVTILIRIKGQPLPFDISNLRVFEYGPPKSKEFQQAREQIVAAIAHARSQHDTDSLVFHSLPELAVTVEKPKPIKTLRKTRFALRHDPSRHVGLIGGRLADVRGVSVWVNSENADMQMSRYYEPTISGTIRYQGAKRSPDGRVLDDLIADDLAAWMRRHNFTSVMPGTVIRTTAGQLADFGVKFVLHVAAVHATPGVGYHSVQDLSGCITNVLRKLDEQSADFRDERASVVIPLLGTGAGGGKVELVARDLIGAALDYLEHMPGSIIDTVWFLAYFGHHWDACIRAFDGLTHRLLPAARGAPGKRSPRARGAAKRAKSRTATLNQATASPANSK
jgi:O-acetyl-ADP-ribose deacetylase (regulator of RNase III)